ncbi:cbb3-type cytochrome c oxidase subunit I [Halocatena marina]|uniref:Cbb3-type cytochrome c oxidase subunit I n=1 Tax=Halocatena marina TaxID=2934937 RepID=A0ABD5YWZ0_9EURY|nr:cbb3-type cytochrome c oxidase subunit I [Halocatena marina]
MDLSAQLALTIFMGLFLVGVALALSRMEDWRSYTPLTSGGTAVSDETGYISEEKPSGLIRWLTTVDHKDIGMLYGAFSLIAFMWAGLAAFLLRAELMTPEMDLLAGFGGENLYNALMTSHGTTMLFLFATPIIAALGNYFIPLLIGADDMAFPRINAIAFWLLPPGALLIWGGFFLDTATGGAIQASQTSWTMYTPLSAQQVNPGVDLFLLGLHLTGVSTTMGAINFIATIFTERSRDVTWASLDIFSWTILTQSGLVLFAFPLLGSALIMLLLDRNFGSTFFAANGGGSLLWQHLFWFFGHPEVYIIVLPPMGIVSLVIPKFAGRKLFGFKFIVYSTLAIGVLSFGVWAHHMFATGIDPRIRLSFMAVSLAIAIPSAVKTFNWITTMWDGNLRLTAPMLFCIGFVSNFIIGGVTGVFLAAIPVDLILTDTYYVIGHFHYIVMGAIAFAGFAALYYWYPIFTGRMYQRTLARWHFWFWMLGSNITFFAMLLLGYEGMPRRYATYALPDGAPFSLLVENLHQIATFGAFLMAIGTVIWLWNFVVSWYEGPEVGEDPWNFREYGMTSPEFEWHARRLQTTATDGGDDETTTDNERTTEPETN